MSKGSNLPFRRLCCDFGAETTISEMVFASALAKHNRKDLALLRRSPQEHCFGVQILTNNPEDVRASLPIIEESGADFVDLNCGCPIDDAVNRGMGAQLLDRQGRMEQVLAAMQECAHIPFTVKLRAGYHEGHVNIEETAAMCEKYGACAITVHGRTREQRYTGSADWNVVKKAVETVHIPVAGNGDILTWYEAEDRLAQSGAAGVMIGRGALIKPWIFQELREKRDLNLTPSERVEIYLRLTRYMLEHFGGDAHGQKTASSFLFWHFDLFSRYRFMPESKYREASRVHPLIQTRFDNIYDGDPLEVVLAGYGKTFRQKLAAEFVEAAADNRPKEVLEQKLTALAPELIESYRVQAQRRAEKKAAKENGVHASASGLPFCEVHTPESSASEKSSPAAPASAEASSALSNAKTASADTFAETGSSAQAERSSANSASSEAGASGSAAETEKVKPAFNAAGKTGTPHIGCSPADFAPVVLMPGDPLRSRFIAETYFENARLVNDVRGVQGYTGFYKGKRLSVMASGMGAPSMGIYSHELFAFMGVKTIIRIGTCGGMVPDMKLGSIFLAQGCSTNSNFISQFHLNGSYAPLADFELLRRAFDTARLRGLDVQVGNVLTSDIFYGEADLYANWTKLGVTAVEMESAVLYTNAALHGCKALAVLTVSDVIGSSEVMTPQQRQTSLKDMIELALEIA